MGPIDSNKAAIERVGENLQKDIVVVHSSLELQSGWAIWRENASSLDKSWNSLFRMGDSMIGLLLKAV